MLKRHWTICLNAPEKKERLILKTLNKELLVFNQTCINETHAHTGIIGLCLSRLTIDIAAIFTVSAFAVTLIIGNELPVYSLYYHDITVIKPVHITSAIMWNEMQGNEFMPLSKVFSGN